jgi:hypothetical protein
MLTLAQAATMTGMNRSTILRAIKRVAITGTKGHNDVWQVNGAEQARTFPVTPPNTQLAPQDTHPDALAAHKLALAEERITELKERLEEMRQERDRARAGEDAWKTQCEAVTRQLALPAPQTARQLALPAPQDALAAVDGVAGLRKALNRARGLLGSWIEARSPFTLQKAQADYQR